MAEIPKTPIQKLLNEHKRTGDILREQAIEDSRHVAPYKGFKALRERDEDKYLHSMSTLPGEAHEGVYSGDYNRDRTTNIEDAWAAAREVFEIRETPEEHPDIYIHRNRIAASIDQAWGTHPEYQAAMRILKQKKYKHGKWLNDLTIPQARRIMRKFMEQEKK